MVELGPLFFILAFFLGASSGSFACAAASRTAAGEKWWGLERSRCDCCGTALAPRDLVPVLSFLALPVIPDVRLTDLGVFDVNRMQFIHRPA